MNTRTATHFVSMTITPIFLSMLLVLACSHRQAEQQPTWPGKEVAATPAPAAAVPAKAAATPAPAKKSMATAKPAKKPVVALKSGKATKVTPAKAPPTMTLVATVVGKKVTMFVATETLNVRSNPSQVAPVVGKLTRGSMFNVTVQKGWAKIGDGQYVSTRYLSASMPVAPKRKLASK